MIDYHIHTGYSRDVEKGSELADYLMKAKEKNLKEIAVTNHFIIIWGSKHGWGLSIDQISSYFESLKKAQEDFGLKIKIGLEVDYFQDKEKEIEKILDDYPFDIILGSAHFIDNISIDNHPILEKYSQIELYKKYFTKLKLAIESQLFDVMSHLDFIRRFSIPFYKTDLKFEYYGKEVKQVIEALVDNKKIGIEINTSGFSHPHVNDSYPSLDLLKMCKESGVKIVTIGSDAHSPSRVGLNLEKGIENLKKVGYEKIFLFDRRKPMAVDLD